MEKRYKLEIEEHNKNKKIYINFVYVGFILCPINLTKIVVLFFLKMYRYIATTHQNLVSLYLLRINP